jgi:hypothetical protein
MGCAFWIGSRERMTNRGGAMQQHLRRLVAVTIPFAFQSVLATSNVYGNGAESCAQWTERRQLAASLSSQNKGSMDWMAASSNSFMDEQWVYGFASGYFVAHGESRKPLAIKEISGATAWIDDYCRQNPLESVATAARQLVDALKVKE